MQITTHNKHAKIKLRIFPNRSESLAKDQDPKMATNWISNMVIIKELESRPRTFVPNKEAIRITVCTPAEAKKKPNKNLFKL